MAKKKSFFKRIGSYFIEIIIIIIGISLSFALNDWEQKKSARTDYQNYLKRLQEDIRVDSIQMRSDIQSYQSKINGIEVIFKFHKGFSQDSIALLGQAQNALSNNVRFLPNDNTFQVLSSTGDFKAFSNDSLILQLFQLYRYDYAFVEMMGEEANNQRTEFIKPYLIENIYYEDEITFPIVRTDIAKIVSDRTFRNICLDYNQSCYGVITSYQRALARLTKVSRLIRQELEEY
tara:strand:- start:42286 stop:42984 length:699 start_codon:yes stop_codon:yes gene_type:complete